MLPCSKRMTVEQSGRAVLWPGEMATEVCLCNKRRKVMPSSAVAVLPDEIMTEVLLRLPVKSILRFQAVCRSWAALLSSEEFCNLHMAATEVASTPPKLLFASPAADFNSTAVYSCSLSGCGDDLLFNLDDARGNFMDVAPAACRGLTLLYDAVSPAYYVCNAATRAVTRLPPYQDVPYATAGLGFDNQTKKYKVVRFFIANCHENQPYKCEVYTLGCEDGDHWRPVAGGVPFRFCKFASSAILHAVEYKMQPIFANGFLHWLINPLVLGKVPRAAIISFSLTSETFSWVRSPPFQVSDVHLVELDGHLCMVRDLRSGLPAGSMLEIWKLKDYSSGDWSLNHQIDLSGHVPTNFLEPRAVRVIGSVDNIKSTKRIIIATSKHKVFAYEPLSKTLEIIHSEMEIQTSHQIEPSDIRFSLFIESLVPVHKTKDEMALSSPLANVTREILLRLPAESVHKFKLVCKPWLRLIRSEVFSHAYFLHKNRDRRPKVMLVGKGSRQPGFCFIPLNKWLLEATDQRVTLLDTKVVCSKPCHGLNLVSIEKKDYMYNPCIGFLRIYRNRGPHIMNQNWKKPVDCCQSNDHPFAVGSKNVGLGFNPLTQEHVIMEIFYHLKDYRSREYYSTCLLWGCNYRQSQQLPPPPLPVNTMPPAYLEGMLYWMSEPRLGQSHERAIVSFNIATKVFDVIPCPSCIALFNNNSVCHAFVVELEGVLCAVLANPVADELDIWKWELGQWYRAYTIYLKLCPDYSLGTSTVVPLATDPTDGRVLLSTGTKLGLYNPLKQAIENSFALDQRPLFAPERHTHADKKASAWKPSVDAQTSSASSGKDLSHSNHQSEEPNGMSCKLVPLVPMLYEENLKYYPGPAKARRLKYYPGHF